MNKRLAFQKFVHCCSSTTGKGWVPDNTKSGQISGYCVGKTPNLVPNTTMAGV